VLAIGPVAVRPSAQRRGVGSTLMYAAMSLAMARGAPALVLLGRGQLLEEADPLAFLAATFTLPPLALREGGGRPFALSQ